MHGVAFRAGGADVFDLVGSLFAAVLIVGAWIIFSSGRFVQGGVVERPERVPQLYGYTVCLVALFWALTSAMSIVESSLTLSAPEYRSNREFGGMEPSVSSFEAFRTTYEQSRRFMSPDPRSAPPDTLSEGELHRRYEALRADRIERNTVEARRSLVTSVLSLVIAVALFLVHWRWLERRVGLSPVRTTRIDV